MLEAIADKIKRFNTWNKRAKPLKKHQISQHTDVIKHLIDNGYSLKRVFKFLQNEGLNCSYDFFRVCVNDLIFEKKKLYPKKSKIDEEQLINSVRRSPLLFVKSSPLIVTVVLRNCWREENPNISHLDIGKHQLKKLFSIARKAEKEMQEVLFNQFVELWNNGKLENKK